eukprot:2118021-Rhodomonas_salina.2
MRVEHAPYRARACLPRLLADDLRDIQAFQHSSFALARARSFYGRGAVLAKLRALQALERGGGVRCVHGKSGTGKTSAMSAMAVEAGSARQYHTVVFRACGTSVASSSAMSLMASICEQLEQRYGLQSSQPKVSEPF